MRTPSAIAALLLIAGLGAALVAGRGTLPDAALIALFAFGCATVSWALLPFNAAYVALVASAGLAFAGFVPQAALTGLLAADIIWLMIGAFILGEAMARSGLAGRMNRLVTARTRRVDQLFWLVSALLLPLTFVIPSTSGRAAVLLPLHRSLHDVLGAEARRALAILIPTIILVTTIASLTGAGSHLIANDLLADMAARRIGFLEWLLYGLPFAVAAGAISCFVVLRLFLPRHARHQAIAITDEPALPWSREERVVAVVAALMIGLWLSEAWHGIAIATVAMLGALALMAPGGPLRWSDGLKAVNWDLILFVGAALLLGKALIETGAAGAITQAMFTGLGFGEGVSPAILVAGIAALTLVSHLVMTSHTARAAALVPPLVALAAAVKVDPVALVFIGTVGMNYCLTLPVSSKALLMFQGGDAGLRPADLLRLSAVLAPLHLALVLAFYFGYWRWVGLAL